MPYTKWMNIFPLTYGDEDLFGGDEVYRFPFTSFERFLATPLKNGNGEYINSTKVKNTKLREAFTKYGEFRAGFRKMCHFYACHFYDVMTSSVMTHTVYLTYDFSLKAVEY